MQPPSRSGNDPAFYWLASYPRSGGTWLRFLLTAAYRGPVRSSADVARAVPDVHVRGGRRTTLAGRAFVKTHWHYRANLPGAHQTVGAIYLIRNPVDVMRSALRHAVMIGTFQCGLDDPNGTDARVDARVHQWLSDYVRTGGLPPAHAPGYGSWRQNVASWCIGDLPWKRLVLRYEDATADPAGALASIADFVGTKLTADRIDRAVAECSIDRLRALEEREMIAGDAALFANRHADRKQRLGLRFVDSAHAPGAARLAVPDDLAAALRENHADLMQRFGYW